MVDFFFFGGGQGFFLGVISHGWVVEPSSKIILKLSWTYEMLQCKGKPYRFSGWLDPLVKRDKKTDKHSVIIMIFYNCYFWKSLPFVVLNHIFIVVDKNRSKKNLNFKSTLWYFQNSIALSTKKRDYNNLFQMDILP